MVTALFLCLLSLQSTPNAKVVAIDAGHQQTANLSKEPIAPGSSTLKYKVTQGTCSKYSKIPEYQLNLDIALQLEQELQDRGYDVIMCRDSNDVNISNAERAQIANKANADAFIRIHANGSNNPNQQGMMTICQTKDNPYNGALYSKSYALSEYILEYTTANTDAKEEYVWETDTMSGINWCQVPVTIIEVGYMSNKEEDLKLATKEYQAQIATGIANGLDQYFLEYGE